MRNLYKKQMIEAFSYNETEREQLFRQAYETKLKYVGNKVYLRGLIEFSNICTRDCFYCGIRKSNKKIIRYQMNEDEIIQAAKWAYEQGYGSVVLQSGERSDSEFVSFVTGVLSKLKKISQGKLGITLSLGEQDKDTYKKWFDAGAHRYLLRIETSNDKLYRSLHPLNHDYKRRLDCLQDLQDTGYQVGTGVMIGLPGQTEEDLANDIIFIKKRDIDMIGMGPYILHQDTPLKHKALNYSTKRQLKLTLIMIALTRLYCKDVNIASTTALQTLHPQGRELGLQAGANILMPNIGLTKYRNLYTLYDNKPCREDTAEICKVCFEKRIETINESIGYHEWGDSPHFERRKDGKTTTR